MNNRERAERIWSDLSGRAGCGIDAWEPAIKTACLDMIAAQLDEAVREALEEHFGKEDVKDSFRFAVTGSEIEQARHEGYAAARDQAAEIADELAKRKDSNDYEGGKIAAAEDIADCIRAMTPAAGEAGK